MLTSTAVVLLITPGPAFFYGGMVRSKNLLTTLYLSFISISLVTIVWFCYGYGLAFGNDLMRATEEEQHTGSDAGFAAG